MDALRLSRLVGLSALLLLGGCIFGIRDPEPPTSQAISYLPRSSPANIWENCKLALNNKDTGGWDAAVSVDFEYVPDGQAQQAWPDVEWSEWGKTQEMGFINSWFASGIEIQANLLVGDDNVTPDGAGGWAEWTVTYQLTVTDSQTGSFTRYRAKAVLEFTLEGSYYYLRSWRDEQGEQDPETGDTLETMGMLRGAFGS